jgi:hypothetical protein
MLGQIRHWIRPSAKYDPVTPPNKAHYTEHFLLEAEANAHLDFGVTGVRIGSQVYRYEEIYKYGTNENLLRLELIDGRVLNTSCVDGANVKVALRQAIARYMEHTRRTTESLAPTVA